MTVRRHSEACEVGNCRQCTGLAEANLRRHGPSCRCICHPPTMAVAVGVGTTRPAPIAPELVCGVA